MSLLSRCDTNVTANIGGTCWLEGLLSLLMYPDSMRPAIEALLNRIEKNTALSSHLSAIYTVYSNRGSLSRWPRCPSTSPSLALYDAASAYLGNQTSSYRDGYNTFTATKTFDALFKRHSIGGVAFVSITRGHRDRTIQSALAAVPDSSAVVFLNYSKGPASFVTRVDGWSLTGCAFVVGKSPGHVCSLLRCNADPSLWILNGADGRGTPAGPPMSKITFPLDVCDPFVATRARGGVDIVCDGKRMTPVSDAECVLMFVRGRAVEPRTPQPRHALESLAATCIRHATGKEVHDDAVAAMGRASRRGLIDAIAAAASAEPSFIFNGSLEDGRPTAWPYDPFPTGRVPPSIAALVAAVWTQGGAVFACIPHRKDECLFASTLSGGWAKLSTTGYYGGLSPFAPATMQNMWRMGVAGTRIALEGHSAVLFYGSTTLG